MAYETGSATTQADLLSKLNTFATSNGWTSDALVTGSTPCQLALHKGTVYVQFQGDKVVTTGSIAMYQSLSGFPYGANSGDDSGNGTAGSGPYTTGRRVTHIGNGPFTKYAFYQDGDYIHVALEYSAGLFRHFGFGILDKVGSYTGGEYCYGHHWDVTLTGLNNVSHSALLEARCTDQSVVATVHLEGLPTGFQTVEKWGVIGDFASNTGSSVGTARNGTARLPCIGGYRDGSLFTALSYIRANPNAGFVPLVPLQVWRTRRAVTPQQWLFLGQLLDVRSVNGFYMNAWDTFTLGGDTWECTPLVKKADTAAAGESGHLFVAYKQVP